VVVRKNAPQGMFTSQSLELVNITSYGKKVNVILYGKDVINLKVLRG
jgi:hypothetical protein